jgi:hypothetical protein
MRRATLLGLNAEEIDLSLVKVNTARRQATDHRFDGLKDRVSLDDANFARDYNGERERMVNARKTRNPYSRQRWCGGLQ